VKTSGTSFTGFDTRTMPSKKTVPGRQGEAAGFSILPAALLFE
jgi:hypothetical protein